MLPVQNSCEMLQQTSNLYAHADRRMMLHDFASSFNICIFEPLDVVSIPCEIYADLRFCPATRNPWNDENGNVSLLDYAAGTTNIVKRSEVHWLAAIGDHAAVVYYLDCPLYLHAQSRRNKWSCSNVDEFNQALTQFSFPSSRAYWEFAQNLGNLLRVHAGRQDCKARWSLRQPTVLQPS